MTAEVLHGDCLEVLPSLASESIDAVVCDPPYPCIKRSYGYWTEAEWFALMDLVVPECRRVLKPTGSAVFILQPNSERVGRMRTWLWDFMAKWGREWGIVQDAYWWNTCAISVAGACNGGLMKAAVKPSVWLGPADCWRDQDSVLWSESELTTARRASVRAGKLCHAHPSPSGVTANNQRMFEAAEQRGGVVPMNVMPFPNADRFSSAGAHGHGAGTPLTLCRWWTRYICPPDGTLLDPFAGSGTTGVAAIMEGRNYIGIERVPEYVEIARKRIATAQAECPLFAGG